MSTRALYVFSDNFDDPSCEQYVVYKHHDGYPDGAREHIRNAQSLAWAFPRFEADEFAAAFVAANKDGDGGVRLYPNGERVRNILVNQVDAAYIYWIDFPPTTIRSKRPRKNPRVRYKALPDGEMTILKVHWIDYAKNQIN